MTTRALIVDDDANIVRSIEHIVKGLPQPHDCDSVGDIASARKRLLAKKVDYLVLDMNLPLDPGRATGRRENGRNLPEWIRGESRLKHLPVVVVTGEDKGESDFILSVMAIGGMDRTRYVQKPIDGEKFERAIRDLLAATANSNDSYGQINEPILKPRVKGSPMPFKRGTLEFEGECVYLRVPKGRVKIAGDGGIGHARKMLQMLRDRESDRFVRVSGGKLAILLGKVGIGAVTGAAKTIRDNIRERLKNELNVACQRNDVLVNDRTHGYHLNDDKISISISA